MSGLSKLPTMCMQLCSAQLINWLHPQPSPAHEQKQQLLAWAQKMAMGNLAS